MAQGAGLVLSAMGRNIVVWDDTKGRSAGETLPFKVTAACSQAPFYLLTDGCRRGLSQGRRQNRERQRFSHQHDRLAAEYIPHCVFPVSQILFVPLLYFSAVDSSGINEGRGWDGR